GCLRRRSRLLRDQGARSDASPWTPEPSSAPLDTGAPCHGHASGMRNRSATRATRLGSLTLAHLAHSHSSVLLCRVAVTRPRSCALQIQRALTAEIRGDHLRIFLDFGCGPFGDLLSVVEHEHAVADAHHELHVVLDQQNGYAIPADV